MTSSIRWLLVGALVAAPAFLPSPADAQPTVRDQRNRPGPTEAPPAPRAETAPAKAGYVWVTGRWDWKDGKWQWVAGHYERERAGKRWNAGAWQQRDGKWQWSDGAWVDASAPATPSGPREAPPAPRNETAQTKPGHVWIAGSWDWKDGKWDWTPGHLEAERAGKRWRPMRWEQRDGNWTRTDGDWEDANAPAPPPPMANGNGGRRRDWKLDRPTVSSYWPIKGKTGSRVVIKGKNFPNDAQVTFAGKIVPGAKVTADEIVFMVPAGAVTGDIELNAGRKRPVAVGNFEVAASYDPVAEQKRIEEERRKAAEAAWAAQQAKLAKDRAARQAELDRRHAEEEQTRDQRRQQRIAEIEAKWERAFLADDETQAELTLHAQRVANLERVKEIAELKADTKLGVRVQVAEEREDARHDQRMAALKAAFGGAK